MGELKVAILGGEDCAKKEKRRRAAAEGRNSVGVSIKVKLGGKVEIGDIIGMRCGPIKISRVDQSGFVILCQRQTEMCRVIHVFTIG